MKQTTPWHTGRELCVRGDFSVWERTKGAVGAEGGDLKTQNPGQRAVNFTPSRKGSEGTEVKQWRGSGCQRAEAGNERGVSSPQRFLTTSALPAAAACCLGAHWDEGGNRLLPSPAHSASTFSPHRWGPLAFQRRRLYSSSASQNVPRAVGYPELSIFTVHEATLTRLGALGTRRQEVRSAAAENPGRATARRRPSPLLTLEMIAPAFSRAPRVFWSVVGG